MAGRRPLVAEATPAALTQGAVGRRWGGRFCPPLPWVRLRGYLAFMNNNDAPQDMSSALQELQAQNDELVERLLWYQQEIARNRRSIDLLRALPLHVHQRLGASLVRDLVQAESAHAADQAVQDFPEFLREVERRAQQRHSP